MKTWIEFNETVNDLLLIDGLRKGRGVEKFRDRMIVAGVRDLQSYIPELRTTPTEVSFTKSDLTEHGEKQCQVGEFNVEASRIMDVVVRQLPTGDETVSKYYRLNIYPAYKRHSIFDGGHTTRSINFPGKITFDRGQFYTAPILEDNETLGILYNQEYAFKPMFECTPDQKAYKTKLSDDAALAVHYFVKYHFEKDVNDDTNQAQTNLQNYQRERRKIAVNRPEILTTNNPTESLGEGGFTIGNG